MPLHKDAIRQKEVTFIFSGTYTRQSTVDSYTVTGIIQDIWSGAPSTTLGFTDDTLKLIFGGTFTDSGQMTTNEGDDSGWFVNCSAVASPTEEYTAVEWRDNALAVLQNNTWHDYVNGNVDITVTPLGTFRAERQQQIADGTYVEAIVWTPLLTNADAFADDHPGTTNNVGNHYLNLQTNFIGTVIQSEFTPATAVYESGADEVELTAISTSGMGSNIYWGVGRHFGTNDDGTQVPQWTGTVKQRTTEADGSFKIILTVDTGKDYLVGKAAQYGTVTAPNNIEQLFSTGRQFIVHESVSGVYLLDQITTDGEGYTIYGANTEADLIGNIQAGYTVVTAVQYIDVNFNPANFNLANGLGVNIDGFNSGDVNPTNINQLRLRLQNDGNTGYWGHVTGQANLFGQTRDNGGRPFATNWDEWADLLLVAINTPADAPFSNPTISSNNFWPFTASKLNVTATTGTIRITPRASQTWLSTSYTTDTSNQAGFVDLTVVTGPTHSPIFLTLAGDPNRTGGNTGVEFSESTATTDWTTWGNISFARGATLDLTKGFKLNVGKGYDWTGDAKDGVVTIRENSQLVFSVENRDDLWGGKAGMTTTNRTDANPMTINKRTGGQIIITDVPITTNRTGAGGGNWTFISGEYTAAQNNSLIFNTDNAGTGCYSTRDTYYYPMPGDNINNQIVIDQDGYRLFYEVAPTIKQFDGDNIVFNKGDFLFNMNIGTYGNVGNFDYDSQCVIGDMDISGIIIDSDIAAGKTLGGSTVRNGNLVLFDLTRAGTIYVDNWGWVNTGTGRIRLARRWNPSWFYAGSGLSDIIESYYYETNSETNLVEVKEGCESGVIGTVGNQYHPFEAGVTISSDKGLADIVLSEGQNNYKPQSEVTVGSFNTVTTSSSLDIEFTQTGWDSSATRGIRIAEFTQGSLSPITTTYTSLELVYANISGTTGPILDSPETGFQYQEAVDPTAAQFVAKSVSIINNPSSSNPDVTNAGSVLSSSFLNYTAEAINTTTLRLTPKAGNTGWDFSSLTVGAPEEFYPFSGVLPGVLQPGYVGITQVGGSIIPTSGQAFSAGDYTSYNSLIYRCFLSYTTTGLSLTPDNDSTHWRLSSTSTWASDKPGLTLSYLDGTSPISGNHVDTLNEDHTTAFSYTRRHGFRPSFTSIDMRAAKVLFNTITSMDSRLDPYWQATTVAQIDALADAITEGSMRVNSALQFVFSTSGVNTWNDLYRHIEHRENQGNITDGSTRSYDSANSLNGIFRRIVDNSAPVSADGLLRIIQGDTHLTMNTAVGISTENNAISGIDCGTQDLFIDSTSGVSRDMTGEFKTTGDISLGARNTGTSLVWKNSKFDADKLQITSSIGIGNASNNRLDNSTVDVNTLTFGGAFVDDAGTSHSESPSADYAMNDSTINVVNPVTLKGILNDTVVNGSSTVTADRGVSAGSTVTSAGAFLSKQTVFNASIISGDTAVFNSGVANTEVTADEDITFDGLVSTVIVNSEADKTVTLKEQGSAVQVFGNSDVRIQKNTDDSTFGTTGTRVKSVIWSGSTATSTNDTVYSVGAVTLPIVTVTEGVMDSGVSLINVGCNVSESNLKAPTISIDDCATSTLAATTSVTIAGSSSNNIIDTPDLNIAESSTADTVTNATTIDIVTNSTGSALAASEDINIGANYDAGVISGETVTVTGSASNAAATGTVGFQANSLDSGVVTSPATSITTDISGGASATGTDTLVVRDLLGATSVVNAGVLVMRNLEEGFVNLTGLLSTITSIRGGVINGATANRTLTTTGRILNASFNNITLLSVPTNTLSTQHTGTYGSAGNPMNMEMTNSGGIEFSESGASGTVVITAGPSSGTAYVLAGGVDITIAADDGSNNTDNVVLAEAPFSVIVNSPTTSSDMRIELPSGTITSSSTFDSTNLTRGDTVKYAFRHVGPQGFAMTYGTFVVENLPRDGVQTVNVVATFQGYPRSSDNPQSEAVTATVGQFANSVLPIVCTNIVQDGMYMNKILCEAIGSSNLTFDALFGLESSDFFGSEGTATYFNADSDNVQLTSTTAVSLTTEETIPYFRPTNDSVVDRDTRITAQYKLGTGSFLGQSYKLAIISVENLITGMTEVFGPTLNGTAQGVEDTSLLIPTSNIPKIDLS